MRSGYYPRSSPWLSGPVMALAIVGICLSWRGPHVAGAILLAIVGMKLMRWTASPRRPVESALRQDARNYGVHIPDDEPTWRGLSALYQKYQRSLAGYPALANQYAEIMSSMWERLRWESDLREWRAIPRRVMDEWPMPWGRGDESLNESLASAKRAARQWREAHQEAHR